MSAGVAVPGGSTPVELRLSMFSRKAWISSLLQRGNGSVSPSVAFCCLSARTCNDMAMMSSKGMCVLNLIDLLEIVAGNPIAGM
jgi:hypothetical protein